MKLVTFNIRCDYNQDGENSFRFRKSYVLEKIKKESPDIICFQEVLPHVFAWLKEVLSDYYIIGCGRDEKLLNEQVPIAYKKTQINLLGMEVFWLSETPKTAASRYPDQSSCPRICTEALFQNIKTKEVYRIFNTHLDHIGVNARKQGLLQILNKMERKDDFIIAPAIIAGDFNAFPGSLELEVLKQYPSLVDLTADVSGTFHDFGKLAKQEKIDYILADQSFDCKQVSLWKDCINHVYLSDHYPVCVEIYTK